MPSAASIFLLSSHNRTQALLVERTELHRTETHPDVSSISFCPPLLVCPSFSFLPAGPCYVTSATSFRRWKKNFFFLPSIATSRPFTAFASLAAMYIFFFLNFKAGRKIFKRFRAEILNGKPETMQFFFPFASNALRDLLQIIS